MANLAVKVADLDAACAFYERAGAEVRDRMAVERRRARRRVPRAGADHAVHPRHLRGRGRRCPAEGFLHPALFTDDLDAELERPRRGVGPRGRRGRRSDAAASRSSSAPGGIRLEFMEQLEEGTDEGHPLPPRVGEQPRRVARRDGRLLRRPLRPRRRRPARDPRRPRHWHGVGDLELHLVGAPPRGTPASTRPATTTASRSTTSTPPSPSSTRSGIEYKRGVQGESNVQIWITDPAGNTIELQQETRSQ